MTFAKLRRQWRRVDKPTFILLLAGFAFIGVYFAVLSTEAKDFAYQFAGMVAVLAVVAGIVRNRPADPRPWLLRPSGWH